MIFFSSIINTVNDDDDKVMVIKIKKIIIDLWPEERITLLSPKRKWRILLKVLCCCVCAPFNLYK